MPSMYTGIWRFWIDVRLLIRVHTAGSGGRHRQISKTPGDTDSLGISHGPGTCPEPARPETFAGPPQNHASAVALKSLPPHWPQPAHGHAGGRRKRLGLWRLNHGITSRRQPSFR